jgi:hypothetical protein
MPFGSGSSGISAKWSNAFVLALFQPNAKKPPGIIFDWMESVFESDVVFLPYEDSTCYFDEHFPHAFYPKTVLPGGRLFMQGEELIDVLRWCAEQFGKHPYRHCSDLGEGFDHGRGGAWVYIRPNLLFADPRHAVLCKMRWG